MAAAIRFDYRRAKEATIPLTIDLGERLEAFARELVASGRYKDAGEVVRAGLRLLEDRERLDDDRLAELKAAIAAGLDGATVDRMNEIGGAQLTLRAKADIDAIGDYIAQNDPRRTLDFLGELRARCAELASSATAGRARPELGDGLRSQALGRYTIFFQRRASDALIVRVLRD